MSWDVYLRTETVDGVDVFVDVRNVTFNNGRIFNRLGVHPEGRENLLGRDWTPKLEAALTILDDPNAETELHELEPPNGWGGLRDVRDFLVKLLAVCRTHPSGQVVWG